MRIECEECGNEYERISHHWSANPDHQPEFTEEQWQILTGIVMGDASVHPGRKTPKVLMQLTVPEYLEYLNDKFGVLGTGVKLYKNAEEQAKRIKASGFSPNADPENYKDVYQWHTRTHPSLSELREWYASGKKVFPPDIDLTPTVLKHWYVCDGYLAKNMKRIVISISNEHERRHEISEMFARVDLPTPSYDIQTRKDGSIKCNARWPSSRMGALLDYMGEPLPGFEYKWGE